jgi:hypothetical protein
MLKELFWVRKEEFLRSLALDSDICISFSTLFGGALLRIDLMSGVMPLIRRWNKKETNESLLAKFTVFLEVQSTLYDHGHLFVRSLA